MGLMNGMMTLLFGGGRNALREAAEVFRPNAEADAQRDAAARAAALQQFAAEFGQPQRSAFDRLIDGLNRLPRPVLAFGTIGLFGAALSDPLWFAARMQGLALVPEPLWWLMGAVISFYFGARHQAKGQEFQRSAVETAARAQDVAQRVQALTEAKADGAKAQRQADATPSPNAALEDWRAVHGADADAGVAR